MNGVWFRVCVSVCRWGQQSRVEKDRQAMVVLVVCMYVSGEEDGKEFDMLQCIISLSVFCGDFILSY